ncbi:MAG TPA: dihydrodipicolinate synthase family protein [Vicinamibacteria bacterium]|nr:dihydrodipicolinate synthase family protein [Vicinamibacteria bacterium]
MTRFRGVFPIVNTTFREDGALDLESQLRLVRFLLDAGAHGLGLFGNASEGYTLGADERRTLARAIVAEVAGRVPVVVSTGHTGTDQAVALGREAEDLGADALMVLPPYFVKPDADGVFHYFRAISDAVKVPIMVQDAPLMTGVAIGVDLLARMHRELPRVTQVKVEAPPTSIKVSALRAKAEGLTIFGGLNGQFLIEELSRGAVGTMPGSDLTDVFVRIVERLDKGDEDGAREDFARHLPLIRYELQPGLGVSVMKTNLKTAGIIASARVRHPTSAIDAVAEREVAALRRGLDLLAFRWQDRR